MAMDHERAAAHGIGERSIQSVDRAIAILESLSHAPDGCSLSEMARRLSLPPQTVQGLLRTLQRHGWVLQSSRGAPYRLGAALGAIGRRREEGVDRGVLAGPAVRSLSQSLGEYGVLVEWSGERLMPLVEVNPDRELIVRGETFGMERLHVMATGKLLLAFLDEGERRRRVGALPMPALGPRSVTDRTVLLNQLRTVRRRGWVVCNEEAAHGVVGLAVPVPPRSAMAVNAALGLSMPNARYSSARQTWFLDRLRQTATEIAERWDPG